VHASDFLFSLQDELSPITHCLKTQQTQRVSVPRDLPGSLLNRLKLDAGLLVPIVVSANAIGLCVLGRNIPTAFTQQEETWVEAVTGHLAVAFERSRGPALGA